MVTFKVVTTVDVEITAERLAGLFAEMTAEEQARFFNRLALELTFWQSPFSLQLQAVTDCESLTDDARRVMRKIGEYSVKSI